MKASIVARMVDGEVLERGDAASAGYHTCESCHQIGVTRLQTVMLGVVASDVGDVLAVGVVALLAGRSPVDPEAKPRPAVLSRACQMAKQAQLDQVAVIAA